MANIAQPQRQIHYISELKKIFVGRNNQPVTQKFKIDTNVSDDYYFQIVNKNNQIVSLAGRSFKVYGSYIDAKRQIHILFFTESFSIEDNVLHFHLNTNTNEYNEYITTEYKEIQFTIIETTGANTQVALRDVALAYRRPYIDQDTQVEIVYRDILTGINVPLTGSFGVGENINLFPGANSFAFGEGLITQSENQTVFGQYNEPDAEQLFIFGNGSDDNNRNNIFTVDKYGNAYLSGARVLNNFDRTNVSQLNNDIGYITYSDIPTFEGKNGIKVEFNNDNKYIFSISATIPSAVSQLVNDTGFITGYTAGSGISIENGVISCTGGGGGGATYTAGEGIGISDQNVISLTATIPSAVSQLTNDNNYLSSVSFYFPSAGVIKDTRWDFSNDFDYWHDEIILDYNNVSGKLVNNGFALTGQIPLSTSQLTNDTGLLSSLNVYDSSDTLFSGKKLKFGGEFVVYNSQSDTIEIDPGSNMFIDVTVGETYLGNQRSLNFSNDFVYNYDNGTIELDQSVNQQKMLIDDTVQTSAFVLGYNKDYDIFYNTIATDDGVLNINPVSGFEGIEQGKTATFEQWIKPNGTLTGITFGEGLDFIGQLPSGFTDDYTQVFTRRIYKKNSSKAIQQISYAYEFGDQVDYLSMPLTFKAFDDSVELIFSNESDPQTVSLQYSKNGGVWTQVIVNDPIYLDEGDTIAFKGNNSIGFNYNNNPYKFSANGNGKLNVYGNIMSLLSTDFENMTDFNSLTNNTHVFRNLFEYNHNIVDASNLQLPATTVTNSCYNHMFYQCYGLTACPSILPATTLAPFCYQFFICECTSLTKGPEIMATTLEEGCFDTMNAGNPLLSSIIVHFTQWDDDESATSVWLADTASTGTLYCPADLDTTIRDGSHVPSNWTVVNI